MVRLRENLKKCYIQKNFSFNSKMVRLRAYFYCFVIVARFVSIPKWCDWERRPQRPRTAASGFQFQNGAIESLQHLELLDAINYVSIPKWCDWEEHTDTGNVTMPSFQFQNGAIERLWKSKTKFRKLQFQFQNGAIESKAHIIISKGRN